MRTCLCLITRPAPAAAQGPDGMELLLGYKKAGFGAGRWVGIGGHIEEGEAAVDAAVREVEEETSLVVMTGDLAYRGTLTFVFPARPSWDQTADVFVTSRFSGEPAESDEVAPRWFPAGSLPFDGMWDDARYWMPVVLAGQRVDPTITFAADCATVARIEPSLRPSGARS
jgi:8-oxo-dGTP diphosphatase